MLFTRRDYWSSHYYLLLYPAGSASQETRRVRLRTSPQYLHLVNEVIRDFGLSNAEAWDFILSRYANGADPDSRRSPSPSPEPFPGHKRRKKSKVRPSVRRASQVPHNVEGTSNHAPNSMGQRWEQLRRAGVSAFDAINLHGVLNPVHQPTTAVASGSSSGA